MSRKSLQIQCKSYIFSATDLHYCCVKRHASIQTCFFAANLHILYIGPADTAADEGGAVSLRRMHTECRKRAFWRRQRPRSLCAALPGGFDTFTVQNANPKV